MSHLVVPIVDRELRLPSSGPWPAAKQNWVEDLLLLVLRSVWRPVCRGASF